MAHTRLRRTVGIVALVLVVLAGSVAGGFLFQATVGGPRIQAQEGTPVLQAAPPSLASLVKEVQGSVVAMGTKSPEKLATGQTLQGPQQFRFQFPSPDPNNPGLQQFFEKFFGEPGLPDSGPQPGKSESDITIQTPQGTLRLHKDADGQWWKVLPDGTKEKWDGGDPNEMFGMKPDAAPPKLDIVTTVGSGVVISPTGYIVTNCHVAEVLEKTGDVWVQLNEDEAVPAKLAGKDAETDVAVYKIDVDRELAFSRFADSDAAQIGDWVVAAGQPFGLQHSFTAGIISARGRGLGKTYDDFLQTDAAIHPGNSGGPLYNMNGEIVGINTAIATTSTLAPVGQGIGFAIPSNAVERISKQLIDKGSVVRGYIGVSLWNGALEAKERKTEYGAPIRGVTADGPAAKAGLQAGDVVVSFGGTRIEDSDQLVKLCAETAPGQQVEVEYIREGKSLKATITVDTRPDPAVLYKETPLGE